jgi:hypothetical protein
MSKLNEQELSELVDARTQFLNFSNEMIRLIIDEKKFLAYKDTLMSNLSLAKDNLENVHNMIKEKYGEGRVDLQSGEIES